MTLQRERRAKIEALLNSPIEGERRAAEAALSRLGDVVEAVPATGSPDWFAARQEYNRKIDFCVSRLGFPGLDRAEVRVIRNLGRCRGSPWGRGADELHRIYEKIVKSGWR